MAGLWTLKRLTELRQKEGFGLQADNCLMFGVVLLAEPSATAKTEEYRFMLAA